jgi:molybdopterin-guanine dinucleotide biosynthesis protein A
VIPVPPLQGLVLAGGQSSRMGSDKASLSIAGNTLLERAVAALSEHLPAVYVSITDAQAVEPGRAQFKLIKDELHAIGPAAGILSAHLQDPEAAWLVVACDMPLLDSALIGELIAGRDPRSDATAWLPEQATTPEPLCAIYEPATLAAFLNKVQAGSNPSPRAWLLAAKPRLLPLTRAGMLDGANTREEFKSLTVRLENEPGVRSGKTDD